MISQLVASILLISFSPLLLLVSTLIAFFSGLPVIYAQNRVGKNGKIFTLYKFRTMENDAEIKQLSLVKYNEAAGPAFKIRNDPRFTRIGKFLSHTGLDELPQIINIIKGDMAFIGPRPLPVSEAAKLKPWMQKRHVVKPGIISPWVLDGYHRTSFEDWMKSDIAYAQKKNIRTDIYLFGRAVVLLGKLFIHEVLFK